MRMNERKVLNLIAPEGWVGAVCGMFAHRWAQRHGYDSVVARYTNFQMIEIERLYHIIQIQRESGLPSICRKRTVIVIDPNEDLREYREDRLTGMKVFDRSGRLDYQPIKYFFLWLRLHRYWTSKAEKTLRAMVSCDESDGVRMASEGDVLCKKYGTDEMEYALTSWTRDHPRDTHFDFDDFEKQYLTVYKEAPHGEEIWNSGSSS